MLRSNVIRITIAAYCFMTLPFVLVFLKSEYVRYVAIQMATNWRGKLIGVPFAYIGDSITAGGRNWGAPLRTINLAGDGYTVWQIANQLRKVQNYSPERLFILAGTNDIIGDRLFNLKQFELDYTGLLDRALRTNAEVFVTLIPFTSRTEANLAIESANQIIRALANSRGIPTIDLNPTIAPHGVLLPKYTRDGVHFTPEAYRIWMTMLRAEIQKQEAQQASAATAD
jgi:lysophospholipase L1-like esterase